MRNTLRLASVALAAGAAIGGSAATASAFGGGFGSPFGYGGGAQLNNCFTNASIGGDLSPSGGGNSISANCINVGRGNGLQANHCTANNSIDVEGLDVLGSDANTIRTNCANIDLGQPYYGGHGYGQGEEGEHGGCGKGEEGEHGGHGGYGGEHGGHGDNKGGEGHGDDDCD